MAPDAAVVVARLTGALRDHDTRFLDDYLIVLVTQTDTDIKTITDQMLRNMEAASADQVRIPGRCESSAGVVVTSFLAAATAWRTPRSPVAPRTLFAVLHALTPQQVEQVACALHKTFGPRELMAVSDALRGAAERAAGAARAAGGARTWALAGRTGLTALLLRGALGALLRVAVTWRAGPLSVEELRAALAARWDTLDAEAQLTGAALAVRVVAGAAAEGAAGEGPAAARLLAALAHPPPPALRHNSDYLQVTIALSRLQKLFPCDTRDDARPGTDSTKLH